MRSVIAVTCLSVVGCYLPQMMQPLRLYDLESGRTIEVVAHQTSRDHGTLSSSANQTEQYHGEFVFLGRSSGIARPLPLPRDQAKGMLNESEKVDLAELYGFGKNSFAQPEGTGILVGEDSTVIQIVFYSISHDLQAGDGVGKDNKGRYYRVYLSTEAF